MNKYYLCVDLKTFFASVECVERGLDPFKTDLVVADSSRGNGTICLAISPKMKARGIRNRCRFFEIPKYINPIVATPRMKKYIEYSTKVYNVYLKYISEEDVYVYSIDECFLDVTSYLKLYKMDAYMLAKTILNDIFKTTGLTAAVGIGTNMYLCKIALDITAKHSPNNIGFLDLEKYKKELWHHTPLTDFWQIGPGIQNRLSKLNVRDMYDISVCDEKILYKEFGINAKSLIEHSNGIDNSTIKQIKEYKPKSKSMSNSQILFKDYNYKEAKVVLTEMIDNLVIELASKNLYTDLIGVYIGYSKDIIPSLKFSKKIGHITNSYKTILNEVLDTYDYRINQYAPIRKIGISFNNLTNKVCEQLDIFNTKSLEEKDEVVEKVIGKIKNKYGKNSILKGVSLENCATQKKRNSLIGGHNAE